MLYCATREASQKEKYQMITCMLNLKCGINEPAYETETWMQKLDSWPRGWMCEGLDWESVVNRYKLAYTGRKNSKVLLTAQRTIFSNL